MNKPAILISACLLGAYCRYNGTRGMIDELDELKSCAHLIPVCPETLGGLPTPRHPAEIVGDRVMTDHGEDVTEAYRRGAQETLMIAQLLGAHAAILKERSPSCGAGEIYDGSFQHVRTSGDGTAAGLLKQNGIAVYGESRVSEIIREIKEGNIR